MKRLVALLLAVAVSFLMPGCAAKDTNTASAPPGVNSAVRKPSVTSSGQQSTDWPTKEWKLSSPEQQGLDSAQLKKSEQFIATKFPNVFSLLVVRHGYLVYEKYYQGMDQDDANAVYSVTKSVISALTGIALREKLFRGLDQPLAELLPDYFSNVDNPQKKDITIRNVLTMTGGLDSVDSNFGAYFVSPDWMAYALQKPLISKPGSKFNYNTGLTHFLSVAITKTSGMSTWDFANKNLFSKIGITHAPWQRDSKGYYGGGFGLYLKPRDMAKFGYLYLHKGQWNGEQVVPQDWVEQSTTKHIGISGDTDYGYLFWLQRMRGPDGKTYSTFRADGAGGQKIIVVPELDMVAVVTADANKEGNTETQDIVSECVFPAVKK